ncbi:50S ribosomal protein L25 [Gloeobacter kilaueensis]|uniref:Large ribosomal subunit protein bL25 n=1 Tax=Gloeobacter kilaueensis (strain ATCC BAA-2537 / CCAP 1431/1 / ULC 316 / JS1) TaxID=1183438 RepID=U5QHZ6_GLOK1|nr:50S ribosomal protein L25 [Gloeobacter kilaueensis]AGY57285.1 50S ribosomal protein L25/general stress protein Ctc [Gloeobacter kilaueensis JS1]
MSHPHVTAAKRTFGINPRALRRAGKVPAVLYGHQGTQSVSLEVELAAVEQLMQRASVNNTVIDIVIAGVWSGEVLLREKQMDHLLQKPQHLSFFAIAGHGPITMNLPIVFIGEPARVTGERGIMEKVLTELAVIASPESVPESIEVDVSRLGIDDVLHVGDIELPVGLEVLGNMERVVVIVKPSAMSNELASLEAGTPAISQLPAA